MATTVILRHCCRASAGSLAGRAAAAPLVGAAGRLRWASAQELLVARRCFAAQPEGQAGGAGGSSGSSGSSGAAPPRGDEAGKPQDPNSAGPHIPGNMGPDSGEMKKGGDNVQFTWRSALFTCIMSGSCLAYYEYLRSRKEAESRAVTKTERLGKPRLGGPFELLDRKGKPVTDKDFLGQYMLIYFGFTFCPDICPQEMEKQTRAVELIDEKIGPVVTPVFISIDPKRDSPEQVDDYCNEFHPRIAGLTGTPEQVKQVSRAYRVYFNEGIKNTDKDYLIDHSIIHYFVGKKGKFVDFFGKNMTAQEMADKMAAAILTDQARAAERKARRGVESADPEDDD